MFNFEWSVFLDLYYKMWSPQSLFLVCLIGNESELSINTELMLLQEYKLLFEGAGSNPGDKTLEDRFFEHEVSLKRGEKGDLCNSVILNQQMAQSESSFLMGKCVLCVCRWSLISWPSWISFISVFSTPMSSWRSKSAGTLCGLQSASLKGTGLRLTTTFLYSNGTSSRS